MLPFFIMAKYRYSVATSTTPLYDDLPDPLSQAILEPIFGGESKRITTNILNRAISGINWKMESFFTYGKNQYSLGVPYQKAFTNGLTDEQIAEIMSQYESQPYVIDTSRIVPSWSALELTQDKLTNEYGYNRYTSKIEPQNHSFDGLIDDNYARFQSDFTDTLAPEFDALKGGIPVNRTIETGDTYNGEPATRVDTYTVTTTESQTVVPSKTVTHRYDSFEHVIIPLEESDRDPTELILFRDAYGYKLYFSIHAKFRIRALSSVTYQETRKRHYVLEDGSTTQVVSKIFDPVTLNGEVRTASATESYYYDEEGVIEMDDISPDLIFQSYIEYHTIDSNGKKQPKLIYTPFTEKTLLGQPDADPDEFSQYYPTVPFISQNENMFDDSRKDTELYKTSIELLKRLDVDALAISAGIQSSPSIKDIDEAYFMLAVDVETEKKAELMYLMEFFTHIYDQQPPELKTTVDQNNKFVFPLDNLVQGLMDIMVEDDVSLTLAFNSVGIRNITGSIGKVGSMEREFSLGENDKWYIRQQTKANEYKELVIVNPTHRNWVYGNGSIETSLREAVEDEDNKNFIIPLHRYYVNKLNSFDRQKLLYAAPKIISHAYEKSKIEWYETKAFKQFLVAVTIVITIATGVDVYTTVAAAFTAGGVTHALIVLVSLVLEKYLITLALEYAVELVGVEAAFVAAIAAMAAGLYTEFSGNEFLKLGPTELLQLSTGINSAISTNLQKDMLEFQAEVTAFQDEAESLMDELEAKQELLKPSNIIDPFYFVNSGPIHDFNEEPSNFYRRTTQTNIADLSYAAIENFAEVNLSLPKPKFN